MYYLPVLISGYILHFSSVFGRPGEPADGLLPQEDDHDREMVIHLNQSAQSILKTDQVRLRESWNILFATATFSNFFPLPPLQDFSDRIWSTIRWAKNDFCIESADRHSLEEECRRLRRTLVFEKEGFRLVKEKTIEFFVECTELKRSIEDWKETRRRNAAAIKDLQAQKAKLEKDLSRKAVMLRSVLDENGKLSAELRLSRTRILELEQEKIKSHSTKVESTSNVQHRVKRRRE